MEVSSQLPGRLQSAPYIIHVCPYPHGFIYIRGTEEGASNGGMDCSLRLLLTKLLLDVCGEGGEYESLVLDCPLFPTKRLVVDSTNVCLDTEDESVGILQILSFHTEYKGERDVNSEEVVVLDSVILLLASNSFEFTSLSPLYSVWNVNICSIPTLSS